MNFFEHQDRARRTTKRLAALFVVAVIAIVAATTLVVALAAAAINPAAEAVVESEGDALPFDAGQYATDPVFLLSVAGATLGLIALASVLRIMQLGGGGAPIAERLGGRLLDHDTADANERRLLNVVEEMAIASGTPVPPVYVLPKETGINAFAAGYAPDDAVIGVTRGAVEKLNRDELQGVIAHEFSHVLSGDMRMNIRLIGVLAGILVIGHVGHLAFRVAPYVALSGGGRRSSGRSEGGGGAFAIVIALWLAGAALMAIGFVGSFFGSWIKSALSRQREYLADASAVQFTRNPQGIGGALQKIGGYAKRGRVRSPNADETSHMFFATGLSSIFATHPPLSERIKRVDPSWDGTFPHVEVEVREPVKPERERREPTQRERMMEVTAVAAAALIGQPSRDHLTHAARLFQAIPESLRDAAHEPYGARAVTAAMVMSRHADVRDKQHDAIKKFENENFARTVERLAREMDGLDPSLRLPLLEVAQPSLRRLSDQQARSFAGLLDELMAADGTLDLFEWTLTRLLRRTLMRPGERPARTHYYAIKGVIGEVSLVVSMLARVGHASEAAAAKAVHAASLRVEGAELTVKGESECTLEALGEALDTLSRSAPRIKKAAVEACAVAISADQTVTPQEAELFRAIAESVGAPTPPVLPGQPLA